MKPFAEFLRFGLVGCMATVTHLLVFFALHEWLHVDATLATTGAFLVAVVVSYGLNRNWTFRATGSHRRQLPRFLLIALCGAVANASIMYLGTEFAGWTPTLCLLIIVLTLPALSFLLQRQWGFR